MTRAIIEIQNMAFLPPSVTVHAGDAVGWINLDSVIHSIVDDANPDIDSGELLTGVSCNRTFLTAGVYPYHCGLYPTMTGTVIVEP